MAVIPESKPLNKMMIPSTMPAHFKETKARGEKRRQDGKCIPDPPGPSNKFKMGAVHTGDGKQRQGEHRGSKTLNRYLKDESSAYNSCF